MKKVIYTLIVIQTFCLLLSMSAFAQEDSKAFCFELTVDGENVKEVQHGDIITVVLKLHRTDLPQLYTMYAMQDELCYDNTFLELIEESVVLEKGIASSDVEKSSPYRELYMNYLSMSGGTEWKPEMLIGRAQFKVIGKSGVSKITNQDCLVSLKDGTGSYSCKVKDVTAILSTDCVVRFMTNGETKIEDQIVQYGEMVIRPEDPERKDFYFEGWYSDINHTKKWDFEKDTVQENMSLYANWTDEEPAGATQNMDNKKIAAAGCLLVLFALLYFAYRYKKQKKTSM